MLDRLVDVLLQVWGELWPLVIVQPYAGAVHVRLGKVKRVLEPGWYLKLPVVDHILDDHVTSRTHQITGQATTTKDGIEIGYTAVVTYKISDIEKATIKVTEVKDAIVDACTGNIGTMLSNTDYLDIVHGDKNEELMKLCRARAWKWGIEVEDVQLAGVCRVRNIRLSGERAVEHHA